MRENESEGGGGESGGRETQRDTTFNKQTDTSAREPRFTEQSKVTA